MAIKISGTTVINDSRNITDVENFGNSDTVYTGNAANLTGIQAGSSTFTASGTIPDGRAVILNSDGTVSIPTKTSTELASSGTPVVFESAAMQFRGIEAIYDSANNKVVIVYRDNGNSDYGTAIVGTVSGTSISFGSPVVFESATTTYISATYDSTNSKVVIAYRDEGNSNRGTAIVGTVSGTSISFGSPAVFETGSTQHTSAVYDSDNGKVVIAYQDVANSNYGTAVVGTVSGTSISFGTPVVFESAESSYFSTTYDSVNGRVVVAYRDDGNSNYGTARVGTVSGTSISFGSDAVFEQSSTLNISATYDSTNRRVVIAYQDSNNSNRGTAIVGAVSGTSISFGTAVPFETGTTVFISATYDSTNSKVVIAYRDNDNSNYGTAVVGTVSGESISFNSPFVYESATTLYPSATFDSGNGKVVIAYGDSGNSSYGTAVVVDSGSYLTTVSSPSVFKTEDANWVSATYDSSNNKIVVAYADSGNSNRGTAVVGTVSGTSISFGSEVVFTTNYVLYVSATFDSGNGKVVIVYQDYSSSRRGKAVVGTVSGTSISFGSIAEFTSNQAFSTVVTYIGSSKVVVAYANASNSYYGTALVGTISGTSISFGSATTYRSYNGEGESIVYDSNTGKVVIAYRMNISPYKGQAVVGTVSGTSISFGSTVYFSGTAIDAHIGTAYDSTNQKVVVAYKRSHTPSAGEANVGTVSGTSIDFGSTSTIATFRSGGNVERVSVAYDSDSELIVISYRDLQNATKATAIVGSVSGSSINFTTPFVFGDGNDTFTSAVYDSNNEKVLIAYRGGSDGVGSVVVLDNTSTNVTTDNFIGIAAEAISNGASGSVTIAGGINASQSSLTVAKKQYVQKDGTMGTQESDVEAGISISATKINVGA